MAICEGSPASIEAGRRKESSSLTLVATAFALGITQSSSAEARRTVIDLGGTIEYGGYCSDFDLNVLQSSECNPTQLGFSVNLGGQTFDSVVVHSNGVLSFGGPITFGAFDGNLEDYGSPLFVPFLDNRSFPNADGAYVGRIVESDEQLRVVWSECFFSGPSCTTEAFGLTLIPGVAGFTVDFTTGPFAPGGSGIYGFSLPGGTFQVTGAIAERTYAFDARGLPISPGVPEPSTWAMMLLGFGFIGGAMRTAKRQQKVTISYA